MAGPLVELSSYGTSHNFEEKSYFPVPIPPTKEIVRLEVFLLKSVRLVRYYVIVA